MTNLDGKIFSLNVLNPLTWNFHQIILAICYVVVLRTTVRAGDFSGEKPIKGNVLVVCFHVVVRIFNQTFLTTKQSQYKTQSQQLIII